MEQLRVHPEWTLLFRRPFGVLMLAQTVLPLAIVIAIFCSPYEYEGIWVIRNASLSLLLVSLTINLCHVFGLHRKAYLASGHAVFVPFTLLMFCASLLFMLVFAFSTLLCLITFFQSLSYSGRLIATYFLLSVLVASLTFVCGRLAVLIYRVTPNSKILALTSVVLDGEKAARLDVVTGGNSFSPAGGLASQFPPV